MPFPFHPNPSVRYRIFACSTSFVEPIPSFPNGVVHGRAKVRGAVWKMRNEARNAAHVFWVTGKCPPSPYDCPNLTKIYHDNVGRELQELECPYEKSPAFMAKVFG